jgi:D-3-phosphoglycerate dehydrogenase
MKKILANDGIDAVGKKILQDSGFTVITDKVAQDNLADYINSNSIEVLTVRSATKVRKDIIDSCINLKLVVRGGVGIDNIDAEYAKEKGLKVANTPAASSDSVAELVIASMFSMCRFLYDSNRKMPISGALDFNELKKKYSGGKELKGKYTIEKDKIKIVFNNGNKSEQTFKLINDELMFFDDDFGMIYKRDKSFIEKKASTE